MFLSDGSDPAPEFKPTDMLPYIEAPAGEQAIELRTLDIQVVVTGLYAETTQTLTFYNPNSRVLEGNLHFAMPDGAVVCGYALDIDGQMVDGVIVPKEEARRILELEIRKGVDPGLVEQIQGNIYQTRIYPIPAQGTRTIRISYISDLAVQENNASYQLPLAHAEAIDKVSLKVEVVQSPVQPEISTLGNLTLNKWEDRWIAEAVIDTSSAVEDLLIRLPKLPSRIISVEKKHNDTFFNLSILQEKTGRKNRPPQRIGIAWDASGSRQPDSQSVNRDFALLGSLFDTWCLERVDLLVFRNVVETEIKSFGSAGELIDYLKAIPYDGATDLTALDLNAFNQDVETCLLFSDGLNSGDQGLPAKCHQPVITINSAAKCNSAFMEYVASQTNGLCINLLRTTVEHAVSSMNSLGETLQPAKVEGCDEVFVSTNNGRLSILGRLNAPVGKVYLTGPGAPQEPIEISMEQASSSNNISRAWAGHKTRELALFDEQSEEIITLGRTYGLVTPGTSLLVLESLEQYLEYNIAPPESLPYLHQDFIREKEKKQANHKQQLKSQLNQVVTWWKERIKWWQKDFKSSYLKQLEAREKERQRQDVLNAASASESHGDEMVIAHHADLERFSASMCSASEDTVLEDFACDVSEQSSGSGAPLPAIPRQIPAAIATINIQPWSPDTPYLTAMRAADTRELYPVYLQQRKKFTESPSFFLDCGDYFFKQGQNELAVRILSNLEEMQLNDIALLRTYAWRLQQTGQMDLAIRIFERIRRIRDDEPQSHRDLALALSDRWRYDKNSADATRAMDLFYDVITRSWDRFPEIEIVALMELNHLVFLAGKDGIAAPDRIDRRLIHHLDLDIRISMSWNADLTDVDLHVFEPDGGHAYYAHNKTLIGGLVSKDFTQGYGPEEYILHNAMPGTYLIKAHYYGSHQQTLCGPCTITATVFTNYGRENEQKQVLTLRLEEASDQELVGQITIEGQPWVNREQWNKISNNDLEKFKSLRKDMSIDDAQAIAGQPNEICGDETVILSYTVNEQATVELHFSPKLHAVKHLMTGCTLDLM
jgi:tetratricopeptide (TPR) repeat protein